MSPERVMEMLRDKGQAVTLTVKTVGAYNPATGGASVTTAPVTTVGVVLPLSRGLRHMEGSTIAVDDQQLLLPGDIDQPAVGTIATIGGKPFTIVEIAPLSPAGEALIYDCIIRGAP